MASSSAFRYVLDELENALGCRIRIKKSINGPMPRSGGKWGIKANGKRLFFERGLNFSSYEKKFAKSVLDSFRSLDRSLNKKTDSRGVAHQYRQTSIMASVFDIAVSRFISSSKSQFLNIHTLIQYFKRLSFESYEGEQVKTGIFFRKGKRLPEGRVSENNITFKAVPFNETIRMKSSLLNDTPFFRYVDGVESFYCCDANLDIHGYINVLNDRFDVFNRLSGARVETIIKELGDIYFYIGITNASDIEIFIDETFRILFRRGQWFFIDSNVFDFSLVDEVDYAYSIDPWRVFYSLSKIRKGAAALVVDDSNLKSYENLHIGHVAKDQEMFDAVAKGITNSSVSRLCETGELLRVLTTDGMTIFSKTFKEIKDFTVIVDTSSAAKSTGCKEEGGGGRTTAVCASSKYGFGIKVSEDGPITIFHKEKRMYKVG